MTGTQKIKCPAQSGAMAVRRLDAQVGQIADVGALAVYISGQHKTPAQHGQRASVFIHAFVNLGMGALDGAGQKIRRLAPESNRNRAFHHIVAQ